MGSELKHFREQVFVKADLHWRTIIAEAGVAFIEADKRYLVEQQQFEEALALVNQ
eukprot:gene9271-2998_t